MIGDDIERLALLVGVVGTIETLRGFSGCWELLWADFSGFFRRIMHK